MTVWIFFLSTALTAQNSPELIICFIDSCIQWCNVSGTSLISDYDIIMYYSFSWYQIQFYYLPKWKLPNRCHANVAAQMCSHSVFHSLWIVVENGAKKCAMLISPHFLFLFFLFSFCLRLPLATALPAHQTKHAHQKNVYLIVFAN